MPTPTDPELYERVKKKIREKYGKPSAYASGAIVKEYKRLGGKYKGKKSQDLNKAIEAVGGSLQADHINQLVNASYQKNKDAPSQIGEYHLDRDLSTGKAKVYHDPVTKKTIVANRGTQGTFQDWANNAAYALGGYDLTGRYQNALDTQKAAIAKYGGVDTNVGHSQSGIITRKMNDLGLTKEVINVNPASKGERQKENETIVRSSLDPVSIFQPNKAKRNLTLNTGYNLLKNHSADILGRLGTQRIGI